MTAALNKRTIIPLTGIVFRKNASSGNRNQRSVLYCSRDSRKLHHTDEVLQLNLNIAELS